MPKGEIHHSYQTGHIDHKEGIADLSEEGVHVQFCRNGGRAAGQFHEDADDDAGVLGH